MTKTSNNLGIYIEIKELDNGFVVYFCTAKASSKFDKNTYYSTMSDVIIAIQNWLKELKGEKALNTPSTKR